MTPQDLVQATAGSLNAIGSKYMFHPDTIAVGKENGLDGFRWYVLGRGGVLGDVEPAVVTSAFGYFHPGTITKIWNSAKEKMPPRAAAARYLQCNADLGRAVLSDSDELTGFCDAASQVIADVNPAGLALFAGIAAEPVPTDTPGQAMHLAGVHRELRGSAHLAAVVAAGVHPSAAHAVRRPKDIETFGWPADLSVPDNTSSLLADVDVATDAISAAHYSSLSDDQRTAFAAGVALLDAALA